MCDAAHGTIKSDPLLFYSINVHGDKIIKHFKLDSLLFLCSQLQLESDTLFTVGNIKVIQDSSSEDNSLVSKKRKYCA